MQGECNRDEVAFQADSVKYTLLSMPSARCCIHLRGKWNYKRIQPPFGGFPLATDTLYSRGSRVYTLNQRSQKGVMFARSSTGLLSRTSRTFRKLCLRDKSRITSARCSRSWIELFRTEHNRKDEDPTGKGKFSGGIQLRPRDGRLSNSLGMQRIKDSAVDLLNCGWMKPRKRESINGEADSTSRDVVPRLVTGVVAPGRRRSKTKLLKFLSVYTHLSFVDVCAVGTSIRDFR